MLSRQPGDRTIPTLVTLLVLGLLLMTFDVRSEGAGVASVLRSGTQTVLAPLQKAAAFAINPVVDMIESLSNIATLQAENTRLRAELIEAEAAIVGLEDDLARVEVYEQIYDIESAGTDLGQTVAQVIGRPPLEGALQIDKGSSDGIAVGQPVIDANGYVVGSVQQVTAGTAIIIPITVGRDGLTVTIGSQLGVVLPQVDTDMMRLEVSDAREPVLRGAQVVTSSASVRFPAGYPVGEVVGDAAPSAVGALTTTVDPYVNPDTLRVVVVLAWPPDPVTAISDLPDATTTTSTTVAGSTTTTGGDG